MQSHKSINEKLNLEHNNLEHGNLPRLVEEAWGRESAKFFRHSRHSIPIEVLNTAITDLRLSTDDLVIDLGCGTGLFTALLTQHSKNVIGIDTSSAMLEEARIYLESEKLDYLPTLLEGDVFAIAQRSLRPALVTLCRSFFAMDRHAVLDELDKVVAPEGALVFIEDPNCFLRAEPWQAKVHEVVVSYLGRPMESVRINEPNSKLLRSSAFSNFSERQILVNRNWSIEQIIASVYSTVNGPRTLLGANREAFEGELRQSLAPFEKNGVITENGRFEILTAQRAT